MHPSVARVDPDKPDTRVLETAAGMIRRGGLVAFPTETVYGLGADATNPEAVERVFLAKGRDFSKPILVLIADRSWLSLLARDIPAPARVLMDAFWPGPLTLTFPARDAVPRALLGGGTTVGVRMPDVTLARRLVQAVGRPVTAPSANRSGSPNPVTAEQVALSLGDRIDLILDGGPSSSDVPSTVVDATVTPPALIRPGRIAYETILNVWNAHVR